jgi:membrane protein YdbS with pleckstrin-like domain
MPNATVEKVKSTLNRPVWSGGRTLYLGEIVCLVIAALLYFFHPLGKWSRYIALAIVVLAMIIW